MTAKEYLKEIDYNNCPVQGEIYEELDIENLSDILELYANKKMETLVKLSNVYIQEADDMVSYSIEGMVSKCYVSEDDFNDIKHIK